MPGWAGALCCGLVFQGFERFALSQAGQRGHAVDNKYAIEMVRFMLHNAGGKTLQLQHDGLAADIQTLDTQFDVAGDFAPDFRATLP